MRFLPEAGHRFRHARAERLDALCSLPQAGFRQPAWVRRFGWLLNGKRARGAGFRAFRITAAIL